MRLRTLAAAAATTTLLAAGPAAAHDPRDTIPGAPTTAASTGVSVPPVMSPNVSLLSTFPETQAISGEFAKTGDFFYVSSLDSISVFDTSDPARPRLRGTLGNLVFENEAMSYGEREVDGRLQRFVLVGNDLYDVPLDGRDPRRGRIGGGQVIVVDVTDPDKPAMRSFSPRTKTSTHTVQCLTVSCEYAYTAGDRGRFSIIDLRDLDAPREVLAKDDQGNDVAAGRSAASAPNGVFTRGSGHYWDVDEEGIAWHTGSGGAAAFDVSDPLRPRPLATTDQHGTKGPYNDFILHNSQRPNATRFDAGAEPSIENGNVLLVTEEDYFHDGEELDCSQAGSFQTWQVGSASEPGAITPLDMTNPVAEFGGGLSTPVGAFCSAHWFDTHQSGIVAQGYYQQGMRLLDVRDPRNIKQFGYFTGAASEVWDAYWVPERNRNGVAQDRKTDIVYSVDLVRGLDVLKVELPASGRAAEAAVSRGRR